MGGWPTQARFCVRSHDILYKVSLDILYTSARAQAGGPLKPAFGLSGNAQSSVLLLTFQNPYNRNNRVPIPGRRRATEEFIQLAQIADGFHVPAIHSEDELLIRSDNPHQPFPLARQR